MSVRTLRYVVVVDTTAPSDNSLDQSLARAVFDAVGDHGRLFRANLPDGVLIEVPYGDRT